MRNVQIAFQLQNCKYLSILQCRQTPVKPGDGIDNDCDVSVDEEVLDGKDNDGDRYIDEDVKVVRQCLFGQRPR